MRARTRNARGARRPTVDARRLSQSARARAPVGRTGEHAVVDDAPTIVIPVAEVIRQQLGWRLADRDRNALRVRAAVAVHDACQYLRWANGLCRSQPNPRSDR